jgi:hypothetical protein
MATETISKPAQFRTGTYTIPPPRPSMAKMNDATAMMKKTIPYNMTKKFK